MFESTLEKLKAIYYSAAFQDILVARLKSLLWRICGFAAAGTLQAVLDYIGTLHLNGFTVIVVGLVVGELTKFINSNWPWLKDQINTQPMPPPSGPIDSGGTPPTDPLP